MFKKLKPYWNNFKKEISNHKVIYILLSIILLAGFFIRVYRVDQILGFYYDQGRDAKVIWDFWHKGDLFLVGPTTGIEGVLRGPWYYWLIAPFYLIGGGDPGWPAVFLAFTTILASLLVYVIASIATDRKTGIFASSISIFSYYLVLASRWLSNPTPMLLISVLLVLSIYLVMIGRKWAWLLIGLLLGQAMQFGSAAEVFYFPAVLILFITQRKNLPSKKIIFASIFLIFAAFIPQIVFDFTHGHILFSAIKRFLFEKGSFKASFWEMVKIRLPFYENVFFIKLFPSADWPRRVFEILAFVSLVFNFKKFWGNKVIRILLILFISPLIGMLFFQGNEGNVFDYYFTGYYFIFVILFGILIFNFLGGRGRWIFPIAFLIIFLRQNLILDRNYIISGVDGPTTVALGNEMQAVDWVFKDAANEGKKWNVDEYVPPVIPHTYDYLFTWQSNVRCGVDLCGQDIQNRVPLLYTIYEVDPPHPERLAAWMKRQAGIGKIIKEEKFGGVIVQKRTRL